MLDEYQKKAVEHGTGPCLVIAGPGSGKTKCIVERIAHLIKCGVDGRGILVITFTREAAGEMEMRYLRDFTGSGVRFCTFHSLFYHILADRFGRDAIAPKTKSETESFYDSLGTRTKRLFSDEPGVLLKWKRRFTHILVDEFQDINEEQLEIVKMLLTDEHNLFAVGDDDQAIYSFRGSSPRLMLSFKEIFPDADTVTLLNNYRCKRQIAAAAKSLISQNRIRYKKEIESYSHAYGSLSYKLLPDDMTESVFVTGEIKRLISAERESTIGVLFRTKASGMLISESLSMEHIPFFAREKLPSVRRHFIFRDLVAMLMLAYDEKCSGRDEYALRATQAFGERCGDHLDVIKKLSPYAAVNYLCRGGGYELYLRRLSKGSSIYESELFTRLGEVKSLFAGIKSRSDFLETFTEEEREEKDHPDSRVGLYTFHGSKGLEFDHVFIIDANEGVTPSLYAEEKDEGTDETEAKIEEERRMFYVAVTRAKSSLTVITISKRSGKRVYPSRFVREMQLK